MAELTLRELYVAELRDLFDAENRLVQALLKMAEASDSAELRNAFAEHLEQTKTHVDRLRQIFESMGEQPAGKKCAGMVGLLQEGDHLMDEDFANGVKDAALISAAQRVEHYEIAAYGCVKSWAGLLGESTAEDLLETTLEEEKETDEKLTELSESINAQASEDAAAAPRKSRGAAAGSSAYRSGEKAADD